MIITNFKTYESATGEAALNLGKIHEAVAKETGADIRICVQAVDLARLCGELDIPSCLSLQKWSRSWRHLCA